MRQQKRGTLYRVWAVAASSCWLLLAANIQAAELKPFSTDGCSEFPDGTLAQKDLWLRCCIRHDFAYWLGGTADEREQADNQLEACVAGVGQPEIALVMLAGVRVGGSPFWPTRYRWGYGWPYWQGMLPRGYEAVSEAVRQQALDIVPEQLRAELNE